jgi:hypothetical protein
MNENDDQMQKLEAGLRDHIIAWQAANPDKALDSAALQRTGSEYMAGQVLGGDWDFGPGNIQGSDDASAGDVNAFSTGALVAAGNQDAQRAPDSDASADETQEVQSQGNKQPGI